MRPVGDLEYIEADSSPFEPTLTLSFIGQHEIVERKQL